MTEAIAGIIQRRRKRRMKDKSVGTLINEFRKLLKDVHEGREAHFQLGDGRFFYFRLDIDKDFDENNQPSEEFLSYLARRREERPHQGKEPREEKQVVRPFSPTALQEARHELNQVVLSTLRLFDLDWDEDERKLLSTLIESAKLLEEDVATRTTEKQEAALKDLFRIREDYGEELLIMDWQEVPGMMDALEVLATLIEPTRTDTE